MRRILIICTGLLLLLSILNGEPQSPAFRINAKLGKGINLGNTFEGPTEGAWGTFWRKEYFQIISDLGFSHVRIPIRWETPERSMETEPYTISQDFLKRIKLVIDTALQNDLMVIINMHHHEELFEDPIGQKNRFYAQWKQIAEYFKDYPEDLIFEVLNEPHGNLDPETWNILFSDALEIIRESNPARTVLMGCAEYGGIAGIPYLKIPRDDNIIVSVHYYNPFTFTHQGAPWSGEQSKEWLGTQWMDTEAERESIQNEFATVIDFSKDYNVPIHVGEFGAYEKADMDSRVRWTRFLTNWLTEQDFSIAYWEFNAGFGIFDPKTNQLRQPLVNALLHDPLPSAKPVRKTTVYQSDFSTGKNGWNIGMQGSAMGALTKSDNSITVLVVNGGTESWHVQLTKKGITLDKDSSYVLSFSASADVNRGATVYIGKDGSPWNAYSGYAAIQLGPEKTRQSVTFTMGRQSDSRARIVFDLGKQKGNIVLYDVTLEKVEME